MADKRISQLVERTDIANNDVLPIVASGATTTNKVTVSTLQDWMQENLDVGVTSVGLSMPSAFTVSNSPVTTSGNISVTGAGTVSQYIRGDGSLADFPTSGGGGSSVSYYLNGSVSQGTIGGIAYTELSKVPILGAGTDFTINADGYIASFITDAGDPALLQIPAGNWNFETYLQASSSGGTPSFYIELYKVSAGGTATLIASNSTTPELIAFGTTINPYFSALAVPTTTLALTDRLAIRYYVAHSGRTITLHTENNTLCQIITTFTTGLTALNGLTAQVQNFATGTSGTDFNISSASTTHTFNLPDASASNRGAVTTGSQVFGGVKTFANGLILPSAGGTNQTTRFLNIGTIHEGSAGSNQIGFNNSNNIYFGKGLSNGGVIQWTNAAVRYYTLPDADGTLALASQLDGYVTLGTAQTITGQKTFSTSGSSDTAVINHGSGSGIALNITKAGNGEGLRVAKTSGSGNAVTITGGTLSAEAGQFSGDLQSATRVIAAVSGESIILTPNSGGTTNRVESVGTLPLALVSAAAITMAAGGTTPQITLATTGAVTLTGALNGTSASFSGAVNGQQGIFRNSGVPALQVIRDLNVVSVGSAGQGIEFGALNGTTPTAGAAIYGGLDNPATTGNLVFQTLTGGTLTTKLTIASTGAATFSGALNGTSASFTGNVTAVQGNFFQTASSGNAIQLRNRNANQTWGLVVDTDAVDDKNLGFYTGSAYALRLASTGAATFSSNVIVGGGTTSTSKLTILATTGVAAPGSPTLGIYDASNPTFGFDFSLEGVATGDLYLNRLVSGTRTSVLQIARATGAATFSSSVNLGSNANAADTALLNIKQSGTSYNQGIYIERGGERNGYHMYIGGALDSLTFRRNYFGTQSDVMSLTRDGNVGIGTASPDAALTVKSIETAAKGISIWGRSDSIGTLRFFDSTGAAEQGGLVSTSTYLGFFYSNTERMRITAGGAFKASNSGNYVNATAPYHELRQGTNETNLALFTHTAASPYGPDISFTGAAPNNTTNYFLICSDTSVSRFVIYSNGNVANTNNSYGAISDIKLKENITDASPKLNDLMKVKVRNYNLIGEETKQIGVIAQELEEIFPAMIDESEDFEEVEVPQLDEEGNEVLNEEGEVVTTKQRVNKGTTTKSVKYSVFVPMLIKAIQELKTEIDSLKNQIK